MKSQSYDAFFIKQSKSDWKTPKIIPIIDRHIITVCQNSKMFGLQKSEIEKIYKKHHENIGWEGFARNEIILGLLQPPVNFVRIRYNARGGCFRIQIFEKMNTSVCVSIIFFLEQIQKGKIRDLLNRSEYPYYNIEIHTTTDITLFVGKVDESIEYAEECEKQNMIVRKCFLLGAGGGATGKVEIISMQEKRKKELKNE